MYLLAAFIAIPLIEIALFIQVGGLIGLWPTLLIVVVTAVVGTALVRSQGLQVLGQLQGALDRMDNPVQPLAHGAMILFSGALLLTPGFFTDAVGFALLVPSVRMRVFSLLRDRIKVSSIQAGPRGRQGPAPQDGVIDGEFCEVDPESVPPRPTAEPSQWTRR